MKDFKTLRVWNASHSFTLLVYKSTKKFPKEEVFGLTSQLRRATVSIELNIAEGCGRNSDAQLKNFLVISLGSASEVECCILIARELKYIPETEWLELQKQIEEIKKMLAVFIKKLMQ